MTAVERQPTDGKADGAFLANLALQAREMTSQARGRFESFTRAPRMTVPQGGGKRVRLATDRVRAAPAISPTASQMIGVTAMGLGIWGVLFPQSVKRTLGVKSPPGLVRALFGAREMATGAALSSDPTRAEVLWARVAADLLDIAVLSSLTRRSNRRRGMAKAGLGFVLAVTALDVATAVRMSTVRRNCE